MSAGTGPKLIGEGTELLYPVALATLTKHLPANTTIGTIRTVTRTLVDDRHVVGFHTAAGHWYVDSSRVVHLARLDDGEPWDTARPGRFRIDTFAGGNRVGRVEQHVEQPDQWWRVQRFWGAGGVVW